MTVLRFAKRKTRLKPRLYCNGARASTRNP